MYSCAELFYSDSFNLAQLFKIPYKQLTDLMYAFAKDIHISWHDFNSMPWYEIIMIVEAHNEFIEKQNGEQVDQNDMIAQQQANMQSMMAKQQSMMPNFNNSGSNSFGNMSMPNMPKFN